MSIRAAWRSLTFLLAVGALAGCMSYTPPKEGPTATLSFVFFEGTGLNGTVTAQFYRDGKRPFLGGAPIIGTVQPVTPTTLDSALANSHVIPAVGQDFVFNFVYGAMSYPTVFSCNVELRFRPEPGVKYLAGFRTTHNRCSGGVMRKTDTGYIAEPTASSAFNDKPVLPPEPTEPLAGEHTPKPNPWW